MYSVSIRFGDGAAFGWMGKENRDAYGDDDDAACAKDQVVADSEA